jgi:hypothetical protein
MKRSSKRVPRFYRGKKIDSFPGAFDFAKNFVDGASSPGDDIWLSVVTGGGRQDEIAATTRKLLKVRNGLPRQNEA